MKFSFVLMACLLPLSLVATPVVITGKMVPSILGAPINHIRIVDHNKNAIPFQIDEMTSDEEYICTMGESPNSRLSNGVLDTCDEIAFLWDDADSTPCANVPGSCVLTVSLGKDTRHVYCIVDSSIALSQTRYLYYDATTERLRSPWYFAMFGHNRFHFIHAGIMDFSNGRYINLTNEMRIEIHMTALFGLIPVHYTEENIECLLKRYTIGPIRLIRRGDFHLRLGFFIKGSNAAVTQICYPELVGVPVYVRLPIRLGTLFRNAYMEMTPVIRSDARDFSFSVKDRDVSFSFNRTDSLDTLVKTTPDHTFMSVNNGAIGYGWLLETTMPQSYFDGSGYIFKMPSERGGIGHCGYRVVVSDMPAGFYLINNWVMFCKTSLSQFDGVLSAISGSLTITNGLTGKTFPDQLNVTRSYKRKVR